VVVALANDLRENKKNIKAMTNFLDVTGLGSVVCGTGPLEIAAKGFSE
jgi:hypothetical protein